MSHCEGCHSEILLEQTNLNKKFIYLTADRNKIETDFNFLLSEIKEGVFT